MTLAKTKIIRERNEKIKADYLAGMPYNEISEKYYITKGTAHSIISALGVAKGNFPPKKKVLEYRICMESNAKDLEGIVGTYLQDGWTPVGGVSQMTSPLEDGQLPVGPRSMLLQAIIK